MFFFCPNFLMPKNKNTYFYFFTLNWDQLFLIPKVFKEKKIKIGSLKKQNCIQLGLNQRCSFETALWVRCNRPLCHGCSTFSCPQIHSGKQFGKSHQILFLLNQTTFFVICDRKVTWELPLVGLEPTRLLTSVPKTDTSTIPPQRLKYWIWEKHFSVSQSHYILV